MRNIFRLIALVAIAGGLVACEKEKSKGFTDFSGGCEAVDLGLSVKWADRNVGAKNPYGVGFFFAWGETVEKSNYSWAKTGEYKWGIYDEDARPLYGMNKYTSNFANGDGNSVLEAGDDPATRNWGTKWRTPTVEECNELCTKCTWTWDDVRKGYEVKGPSNETIFIYAGGYRDGTELVESGVSCHLWTSSLSTRQPSQASGVFATSKIKSVYTVVRYYGHNVRAVAK